MKNRTEKERTNYNSKPITEMSKIYVGNLSYKTTPEAMKTHFESFGKIKEAKLMIRRGYSLGFGFVEYETEEDAKKALAANGVEFEGRKLKVEVARPKKEQTAEEKEKPKTNGPRGYRGARRTSRPRGQFRRRPSQKRFAQRKQRPTEISETTIFVKNLAYAVTDEDLKKLFEKYNVVEAKVITRKARKDGSILSKGYGFVEVKTPADQENAVNEMNKKMDHERELGVAKAFKRPEPKAEEKTEKPANN